MNEYVSKETIQAKLNRKKAGPATKRYTEGWNDAILMVKSMIHSEKAADVAPVRHGRWIMKHRRRGGFRRYTGIDDMGEQHTIIVDERVEYDDRYCSECGKQSADNFLNYCPNCGSKMDGGKTDA